MQTPTRDQVIEKARSAGLTVEPCADDRFIAIRSYEAPAGTNESMRMTSSGALLTVADGYYWQIGTVDDVAQYIEGLQ